MSARARPGLLLAGVLLAATLCAAPAHAGRLDDGARALREPGVWVHRDLGWLLSPAQAHRLQRRIRQAHLPLRVAVLPQIEADESRGDPRAIARALVERIGREGLYVLVDQDGRTRSAADRLRSELDGYDLDGSILAEGESLAANLARLVRVVEAAPRAAPRSFEPYAEPKGVDAARTGANQDPLALVAFGSALLGLMGGFAAYCLLRVLDAVVAAVTRGARA